MFLRALLTLIFLITPAISQTIRLPVTKDNSIVMVDGEWSDNAGGNGRIRIKGNQHVVAMAFDTSAIAGKLVRRATLVCFQDAQEISGITVSSIASPWDEVGSNGLWCGIQGVEGWGYRGARFPTVVGGNGFTLTGQAQSDLKNGQYHWEIPAEIIQAMTIDCAHGIAIHEHDADYRRNPTIFAREQSGKQPYLLVELDDAPDPAPESPTQLQLGYADDDSLRLSFKSPRQGFAYDVSINGVTLGRHNIPWVKIDSNQTIPIRDLPDGFELNGPLSISVVTISRTGKRSKPAEIVAAGRPKASVTYPKVEFMPKLTPPIADLGVIPIVDKYDSTGLPIGDLSPDYTTHNSIYNGRRIHLKAAAGEVAAFQMLLRGSGEHSIEVTLDNLDTRVDMFQAVAVPANGRLIPDPLLPMHQRLKLKPETYQTVVVDIYLPFDSIAGLRRGSIEISDGRVIPLEIELLPFAIPREATFFCEMNGYGLPDHVKDYYAHQRIAYDHRVHANILHYSHNTAAPGSRKSNLDMRLQSGRRMDNKRYDNIVPGDTAGYWDDFVQAFGPYLDGSLFADGHRGSIAAPGFYLTFHESWPLNCRAHFNGNPDAYQAFSDQPVYAQTYINLLRDFSRLADSKSWTKCRFQVYFNNKGSLQELTKSPWILDEPASFWDYRALQFFGELTDQGRQGMPQVRTDYRVDISRPEYCRGQLDGRRDLWVVASSAFQNYTRLITDRIERDHLEVWIYGTSNHVHQSNRNIQAWALDAWKEGANGIVPWQTVNKDGSALRQADQLGLFIYEKDASGNELIHHSLRLKAYREAQQLIEYLNLLKSKTGWSQQQMRQFINHYVDLKVQINKNDDTDAGTSGYGGFLARGAEQLRLAVAQLLSTR